MYID
jgi:V8-like Glu-specific endopeptidase